MQQQHSYGPVGYDHRPAIPPRKWRTTLPTAVAAVAAAVALAGCGGAAPSPPSAWALAHKLPGCSPAVQPGSQLAKFAREVLACKAGQFAGVEIATFRNTKDARAWYTVNTEFIRLSESGGSSAPLGVVGNGWAAVLSVGGMANGARARPRPFSIIWAASWGTNLRTVQIR